MIKLRNLLEITTYQYGDDKIHTINDEEAIHLLKKLNIDLKTISKYPIWKSLYQADESFYYINPNERVIENDYYDLLFNHLESWKKYPKRNKSVVGHSNNMYLLGNSGEEPFLVVPLDINVNILLSPKEHFSLSFKTFPGDEIDPNDENDINIVNVLDDFFEFLNKIGTILGIKVETHQDLMKLFNSMEANKKKIFDELKNNVLVMYQDFDFLKLWERESIDIKILLEKVFNPRINGFVSLRYYDTPQILQKYENNEIWVPSKCLLIKQSDVENLIPKLENI